MTSEADGTPLERGDFVRRQLPWLIAGAALVFYLFTLARSLSPAGLPELVKAAGWAWQPIYTKPLHFLLTFPVRWLPGSWQVVAMNFFGAMCAAATLGLLARSVAILPHDRTRDQRFMERSDHSWLTVPGAWLPPVLAAMVCGLQLTFWENAVVATGESLDLLLFAFVIRQLLEYRVDRKESRLYSAALAYGLGITSDFAFIGFLPLLVTAVVWVRGFSFFNVRFLVRMALFGLAGISLYLLLPLIQTFDSQSQQSFWEVLRVNLGSQKNMLSRFPRYSLLLIGITSVVPVLFMAIKWPASFGDISSVGTALTNLMMHVIHGLLLVSCLAVAFDPQFSPRKLVGPMGYVMLAFYFLGALSIGYFAGYFLLVFRPHAADRPWRRPSPLGQMINRAIVGAVWIALIAVPAGLIYRNLPFIRANTRPYLSQLGVLQAQVLKEVAPQGGIVLSDDPFRLFAVDAAFRRMGGGEHYLLVDTTSLPWTRYHRHLYQRYPQKWIQPPNDPKTLPVLDPAKLVRLVGYLSQSHQIYYLHPSFGYYFEYFYLAPKKLVYQMKPYPTNAIAAPLPLPEELASQEKFWTEFKNRELSPLAADVKRLRIDKESNLSLSLAGNIYSRSINDFGVLLQKAGQLDKAATAFEGALEFNPDNPSAFINLDYNRLLRAGQRDNPEPSEGVLKRLMPYGGNLEAVLGANGGVDEPNVCLRLAEAFARGRNFRQAAHQLLRVMEFNTNNLSAHMAYVSMLNQMQQPDLVLAKIDAIRAQFTTNVMNNAADIELLQGEAIAYLGRKDMTTAEQILLKAQKNHPKTMEPFSTLAEIYVNNGQMTNAMKVLEQALQNQPNDPIVLNQYARLKMLANDFQGAIPYLDRALQQNDRDMFALLNRAISNLKTDRLDDAQRDYERLEVLAPNVGPVCWGLHEIHWRKQHAKPAKKYAKLFLKVAPPGSPEAQEIQGRLTKLESGSF